MASKLESEGDSDLVPIWFIPWYELIIDEWSWLGESSFGSVYPAKWLDSEVVVKHVVLDDTDTKFDMSSFDDSLSLVPALAGPSVSKVATRRSDARKMFRREVDIWFEFSHPHVIQL
ncbi:hypothetical protein JG687_00019269, partial [Phytophthora cactorum]